MGSLSESIVGTPGQTPALEPAPSQPSAIPMSATNSFDLGKSILGEPSDAQKIGFALDQGKTPDQSAKILKLQQRTRLPLSLIEQNIDMVEKEVAKSDFDLDNFTRENPTVSKWLAENPEHAALARDDMSNMGALEKAFRYAKDTFYTIPKNAIEEVENQMDTAWYSQKERHGTITPVEKARLEFLRRRDQPKDLEGFQWFVQQGVQGTTQTITGLLSSQKYGVIGMGAGGAAAIAAGPAAPAVGVVTVPVGYAIGTMTGMAEQVRWQEAGSAREEFLDIKSVDGKPLDQDVVNLASDVVGIANAPLEFIGLSAIFRSIPGAKELLKSITRDKVKELLKRESVVSAIKEVAIRMGDAAGSNALQEALQETTVILAGEISKEQSGSTFDPVAFKDQLSRVGESAAGGAAMGVFMATPGVTYTAAKDVRAIQKAKQQEDFFTALGENAAASKTRERLPEKYQEIVERLTKDGPVENVYAPVEFFQSHWEAQGIDPRAIAKELGIEQQYDEALQTGGKVEIPTAVYARRIAPTPNNAAFAKELTTSADALNTRELDEIVATGKVQTEEAGAEFEASKQKVFDDVYGQLIGVYPEADARAQATLEAARLAARAKRLGVDPWEAYSGRPVAIQQDVPEVLRKIGKLDTLDAMLDRLRTGDVPRETKGPSLMAFLKKGGGLKNDGGELGARDASKYRGLVNNTSGRSLDDAAEQALEAGYITERNPDLLLEALDRELRGEPVYAQGKGDATVREMEQQLDEISDFLQKLGVSIHSVDNATIKRLLAGTQNATEGTEMAQSLPATIEVDGKQRPTTNSEGRPIHPTAAGVVKFWKWFGDSKVVDEQGRPLVVYHGTTHDITEFSPERGNVENDLGVGYYFTSSQDDVSENYAGEGPDLTQRIELRAERIAGDEEIEMDEARVKAKQELSGDAPNAMPVYLAIKNPVVLGGDTETSLGRISFDEETEEESGPGVDLYNAIMAVSLEFSDADGQKIWGDIADYVVDGIGAAALMEKIKSSEGAMYATTDDGSLAVGELIRRVFEYLDYDGVIDNTVDVKFGSQRKSGKSMAGMDYDTIHLVGFKPEQIKSAIGNRGTFDGSGNILYQSAQTRLSVLHNLSSENLEFADKMGGLAVPSLGVVKEGMGLEGYGDVTLIGRKELADPKHVEVRDADAYTSTFPRPEYRKVKMAEAEKFQKALRPWVDKFRDEMAAGKFWDNAVDSPRPWDTISTFLNSNAVKAWFLNENGVDVKPVMSPYKPIWEWTHAPSWLKFVETADHSADNLGFDDPKRIQYGKDMGTAALAAMREHADQYFVADFTQSDIDAIIARAKKNFIDENGALYYAYRPQAIESAKKKGTKLVNPSKTEKKLNGLLAGKDTEFKQWVEDKILPMYGDPFLTIGRKKVEYNIDNIVEYMTRGGVHAQQETMTFGEGKARAVASTKINSLEEMRNRSEWQIADRADVDKIRKKAKEAMAEWRDKVVRYYGDGDSREFGHTWNGLDASMRAIAKWAKGKGLAEALRSEGFKNVRADIIEQGVKAGGLFMNAPVPYFEAKPERVVKLEEFAGAVIPADADAKIKAILDKHKVPYKTYPKRFDEAARTAVVDKFRQELSTKGEAVLFQDQHRGSIVRTPLGDIIKLFKSRNFSTLLHEFGHRWLFDLQEDAKHPNAPQELKDDLAVALKYLGVDSVEQIQPEKHLQGSAEHTRAIEANEKWAQAVEAYLKEGKAPSSALREVFAKFKAWMVAVYDILKQGRLDVQLNDDIRGVFDRILATRDEIEAAKSEAQIGEVFATAADAGMSETEFAVYRKAIEKASQTAQDELERKLMKQFLREHQKWWKEERAKLRTEVEAEVDSQQVYKALALLKSEDGPRLDRASIQDAIYGGKEMIKRLPRGITTKENGMSPDLAADILGYNSGESMVLALANARDRNELVDAETDRRMHETHGDMLTDGSLPEAARQAVANEERGQIIETEIKALQKKQREVAPFIKAKEQADKEQKQAGRKIYSALVATQKQAHEIAVRTIAGLKVRDIKPHRYYTAARQASKRAIDAVGKGDYLMAAYNKSQELVSIEMYREASKAREAIDTGIEKLKTAFRPDEKLAKTKNVDMVNAARAILAAHGIGRSDKAPLTYLDPIRKYDPEMYENMRDKVEAVMADQTHYRDMTFDEFVGLRDSVLALLFTASRSKQIEIDGKLMDRKEVVAELVQQIGAFGSKEQAGYKRAMTKWEKTQVGLLGARAVLRRVELWVDAMDGGSPDGVFRKYIWNPVSEAVNRYREAKKGVIQQYLDIVKGVEKTLTHDKIEAREIGYQFSGKVELLHAILHTGNQSNLTKLLRGRGWGELREDGTLDTSRWDAFVSRMIREGVLTKADYDFAQGLWDLLDGLKPLAQKAHHDMYGYYFDEVTANPINTPFGQYRGGYMPAIVDPNIVSDAAVRKDREELEHGQNSFAFPTTGRGFTMKRIEKYAKPLQLDMRTIPAHIDWVLRFAYVEPAAKDVGRLIINGEFRAALDNLDPAAGRHMLMPWLQRAAKQLVSTPGMLPAVDKFWGEVRRRTGLQIMVGNVINTLQQFTGISMAMTKVPPRLVRNALWQYVRHPGAVTEMVSEKSIFIRNRIFAANVEILRTIDELLLNPTKYEKARAFADRHGYFLQAGTQSIVDKITWVGAYNDAIEKNMGENDAVRHADSVVRETQGSFAPEDISRVEAGTPFLRAFMMFYNYFNMQANLLGTEFANIATNDMGLKKGAGRALYLYVFGFMIPAFIGDGVLRALVAGEPDEDDDGYLDDYIAMFFMTQVRTLAAMVPAVGPAVMSGINVWNNKWYDDRITGSPAVTAIESTVRAPHSVYKAIVDEGSTKRAVQDTLMAVGMLSGLPAATLARPAGYLADVSEGKANPENAMDVARGLVSGRDPNREK